MNNLQKFIRSVDKWDNNFSSAKTVKRNYKVCRYQATAEDAKEAYQILNKYVFDNGLDPILLAIHRRNGYWGSCHAGYTKEEYRCTHIRLTDWFETRRSFIETIAHEMVHQFQWDILSNERDNQGLGPIMSHGPSFFAWRPVLAEYDIPLTKW